MPITDEQRQAREVKKHLQRLVRAVTISIKAIDQAMASKQHAARGERIAQICNSLEMSKDIAARYGLGKK